MTQQKVFAKERFEVRAAEASDGSFPAWDFFNSLSESDQTKLRGLFQYIAVIGQIKNQEKFKKIEDMSELFEFKQFQIRMPCFWGKDGALYITHGFLKKQNKTPEGEKNRAREIMNAHKARQQQRMQRGSDERAKEEGRERVRHRNGVHGFHGTARP